MANRNGQSDGEKSSVPLQSSGPVQKTGLAARSRGSGVTGLTCPCAGNDLRRGRTEVGRQGKPDPSWGSSGPTPVPAFLDFTAVSSGGHPRGPLWEGVGGVQRLKPACFRVDCFDPAAVLRGLQTSPDQCVAVLLEPAPIGLGVVPIGNDDLVMKPCLSVWTECSRDIGPSSCAHSSHIPAEATFASLRRTKEDGRFITRGWAVR